MKKDTIQVLLVVVRLRARTDVILPYTLAAQLSHPNPEPASSLSASLAYGWADLPTPAAVGYGLRSLCADHGSTT